MAQQGSSTKVQPVLFFGGLNLSSSAMEVKPGECSQLFNYEINTLGKYQRISGYERFDGKAAPSSVAAYDLPGSPFDTDEDELNAVSAERERLRALITPVPGDGPLLGIFQFKDAVYAFRNNADATECKMFKSSGTGWQIVNTPTLAPSGNYHFVIGNFSGSAGTLEIIGVDGKNPAFRFDGTTFTQITGPITPDAPICAEVLPSQVLLLAYRGGSFVFSAVGDPTKFSSVDGGGEIAVSDEITGMQVQADNACAIFCRNITYALYGSSKDNFELKTISRTTGAIPLSIQTISNSIYLDNRGLTRLDRVQQFGNFESASISRLVEPLIRRYIGRVTASFVIKEKNQYRLCFDDGTGISLTFLGSEPVGYSSFDFGRVVRCAFSGEDDNGQEVVFFGSDDGFVYQVDKGFSFDGEPIKFVCRIAFMDIGSPEQKKRWKKLVIEADTVGMATVFVSPDFDYSDINNPYHQPTETTIFGGGGYWDQGTWDETKWSSASTFTADVYIDGVSRNIAITVSGSSSNEPPHTLNSALIHYSYRGRRR